MPQPLLWLCYLLAIVLVFFVAIWMLRAVGVPYRMTERDKDVERIDQRHADAWAAHVRFHAQEDAHTLTARQALDRRLSAMNEFRQALSDQTTTFATAASVESEKADTRRRFEMLEGKLNALEREMGREFRAEVRPVQDARAGQSAVVAAITFFLSILGILVVLAGFWNATH